MFPKNEPNTVDDASSYYCSALDISLHSLGSSSLFDEDECSLKIPADQDSPRSKDSDLENDLTRKNMDSASKLNSTRTVASSRSVGSDGDLSNVSASSIPPVVQ